MSADLFAAFDTSFETPKQPQQNTATSVTSQHSASVNDPLSLLTPRPGATRPQLNHQETQWPTFSANAAPSPPIPSTSWLTPKHPALPVAKKPAADEAEDDDGWGDFESANSGVESPGVTQPTVTATQQPAKRPTTRVVRASTIELMTNSLVDLGPETSRLDSIIERPSWDSTARQSTESAAARQSTESRVRNPDPNVLFDADDFDGQPPSEDDEDDFGDFEGPISAPAKATSQPVVDLLSENYASPPTQPRNTSPSQLLSTLSIDSGSSSYPQAPKSPSFHERNPFPGLGLKTPTAEDFPKQSQPRTDSPVTAWPSFDSKPPATVNKGQTSIMDDDWGTFDDLEPKPAKAVQPSKSVTRKTTISTPTKAVTTTGTEPAPDWDWGTWDVAKETSQPPKSQAQAKPLSPTKNDITTGPPPTNIPPPSVLLSIFPSLLDAVSSSLFQPTTSVSAATKERILASPEIIQFLRGYLALATVAAHIIAGRRFRWHRDKFLAQSMTISAATGGKGGMKLTGIDKAQSARDDQEAANVIAAWKDIVGRLRSAVAVANVAIGKQGGMLLKVPELSEAAKPSTLKGAVTAPKPCVVCGLKRDERLAKVDFDVEDSFGEWWVEFWGHRDCRNFWVEHEAALRSR